MKDITPFVKNYRALASRLWNERVRGHGGFLSEWDDCDEAEDRCVELFRRNGRRRHPAAAGVAG